MDTSTHTDYAAKCQQLLARADDLSSRLATLQDERNGLSLKAIEGDKAAIRQIDQIDTAADNLRREAATARAAAEQTEILRKAAEAKAAAEQRAEREAAACKLVDEVLMLSGKVDEQLAAAVTTLEVRDRALSELAALGFSTSFVQRLRAKGLITAALTKSGLGNYAEIGRTPPASIKTLAEITSGLKQHDTKDAA